ncbi:MAG: hypothetical protein KDD40_07670, partial [Bdellovibrionales bacterium]|nr:hypothetical protein [Bdellovibrionales bacterium]
MKSNSQLDQGLCFYAFSFVLNSFIINHMFILISILILFCGENISLAKQIPPKAHWTTYGKRLFGESWTVQKNSMQALRDYPRLNDELTLAIVENKNRELAADVIASLKIYNLIDVLVKYSKEDKTGHLYLAMNALITKKTRDTLIGLYALRITSQEVSLPAKIIMMDTLGRMKHKLDYSVIENWLTNGNYEVQASALNYLRRLKGQFSNKEFKQLAEKALASSWYQIRIQALY